MFTVSFIFKILKLTSPITHEDGEKVMGVFTKINNSEFNLKGELDPEAKIEIICGETNFLMDDFNFAIMILTWDY